LQAYGVSDAVLGSAGGLVAAGTVAAAGTIDITTNSGAVAPTAADPSGSLADGSVPFVSYAGYYAEAFGSNVAALGGTLRRPRIPFAHIDALARDVRDVGIAFTEGEVLKLYHLEARDVVSLAL
jgi:hypothetical protein